jgi:hypothetical protein
MILFLHDKCPGSPGTCNPEETDLPGLPMSWSPTPLSASYPNRTTTYFLDWINNFSSDAEVIAAAETWYDGQRSEFFLRRLQKVEQRAKTCLRLRCMLNKSRVWSL